MPSDSTDQQCGLQNTDAEPPVLLEVVSMPGNSSAWRELTELILLLMLVTPRTSSLETMHTETL